MLRKERATRMEGSFETEKEYYGLQKIKARTMKNEMLWIFFGFIPPMPFELQNEWSRKNTFGNSPDQK